MLAGGSNVVVADAGFPGTVVRVATAAASRATARRLEVAAGESWDALVARCVADGLAGIECLSGIPGSVGATPIQNVGAYGQEVAETIAGVRALDRRTRRGRGRSPPADCALRLPLERVQARPGPLARARGDASRCERGGESAPDALRRAGARARRRRSATARRWPTSARRCSALRRGKGMVIDPGDPDTVSRGLVLHQPDPRAPPRSRRFEAARGRAAAALAGADGRVKTSAAWLIERAGFTKGYGDPDGIAISSKHTLALTNRGAGTTAQLVALAREIAGGVRDALRRRARARSRCSSGTRGRGCDELPVI